MFKETLDQLHRGDLSAELDDALRQLVYAVQQTGKKGTIQLTIAVQPATKTGDVEQVIVSAKLKESPPKPDRAPSLFYTDRDGGLLREDPKQMKMDLRSPREDASPLRAVTGKA